MEWEKLNWPVLDRLREGFLSGAAANGPYWQTPEDLAQYDASYGERIGWKWDAVLRELKWREWSPAVLAREAGRKLTLVDWGCGSGVAGRRVLEAFGADFFGRLEVWDHSPLARSFAAEAARQAFPGIEVGELHGDSTIDLLVLSHVLNELSPVERAALVKLIARANAVIWVEPGTRPVSRDLARLREELMREFTVIAPCTHQAACGLLDVQNAGHWCHSFAQPPPGIYADSDWVRFGQRAGIDLRSLPYSFLVLQKPQFPLRDLAAGASRILGYPEHFKGYATLLNCDAEGVYELMLQKRADPAFFKELKRSTGVPIYRWTREGGKIVAVTPLKTPPPAAADEPSGIV